MAQCVPATGFTGSGFAFMPAQLAPVYACADCGDHERVLSLKTLADTTLTIVVQGNPPLDVTVVADYFRVDSVAGLPAGLTYTTDASYDTTYDAIENPNGYWINAGDTATGFTTTTGCITIAGSAADWTAAANGGPTSDGIYPLEVYIDVRAVDFVPSAIGNIVGYNTWLSEMGSILPAFGDPNFTTNGIRYEATNLEVISSALGITNEEVGNFGSLKNYPNPFSESTIVSFELKEKTADLKFVVYDILGSEIYAEQLNASVGVNQIEFNSKELPVGIYVYSLTDGSSMLTRKMSIQ